MRLVIRHQTRLAFATPVREHHCELRVAPADDGRQARRALRIAVEPANREQCYSRTRDILRHNLPIDSGIGVVLVLNLVITLTIPGIAIGGRRGALWERSDPRRSAER